MSVALPSRRRTHNAKSRLAAPAALHLIASRAISADRSVAVLRADLADLPFAAARRHAFDVLAAVAAKHPGCEVDVQLVDGSGAPVLIITNSGAAAGGAS